MSELELWNEMGNMYYFAGAYDEAIRTYHKVINLDPCYAQSYSNLATILVTQGRHAEAIPIFRKAIELTEEKISRAFLWKQMGDAFHKLNEYASALEAYKNAIELVPEDASLQARLAQVDLAAEADSSGIAAKTAFEIEPEAPSNLPNPHLTGEQGNACWMFIDNEAGQQTTENISEAVNATPVIPEGQMLEDTPVERIPAETRPNNPELEPSAAIAVETLEQADSTGLPSAAGSARVEEPSAVVTPETGILSNISPYALLRLGILHWRDEEYERAVRFLEFGLVAAWRVQDQFLQGLCQHVIARVQTDMGRIEAAIRSYQKAYELAPERIFPWNDLGKLNCKLGKYEEARAAFQKAIEHNPKDPGVWNGLGDVYHRLGHFEDAIAAYQNGNVFEDQKIDEDVFKTFERAIDSEQENPLVWNEAGHIYFSLDAFADAAASYRKAIQLDPTNPSFKANLAKTIQVQEQVDAQDKSSEPDILKEMDLDTQPLPKNFMDEIVSPKTVGTVGSGIHPEIIPQVKPFIPETGSRELVSPNHLQSDSTASRPARSAGFILKQAAVQSDASADAPTEPPADPPAASEAELPYWVFKDSQARGNPRSAGSCFLPAITETVVSTDKPLPAIEGGAQSKPAFSGTQVLTETDQDHFNVLVQMTPRPQKTSWSDEVINTPAVTHGWGKASLDEDAISRKTALAGSQDEAAPRQFVKPSSKPAQTTPQPVNSKESDIAACLRVTEINPCNDRAWDALGNKYEAAGLYCEAIGAYEQAIILCPQKEVYYYHLGIVLAYQMRYDKAILALEKVLTLNPKYTLAQCALAGYYRKLGREEEAKKLVAIARPSMEAENEYNQACFESISGDAERALQLLEMAFEKKQVQSGMIQNDPDLDFIRTDPRFETLLDKNGILHQ